MCAVCVRACVRVCVCVDEGVQEGFVLWMHFVILIQCIFLLTVVQLHASFSPPHQQASCTIVKRTQRCASCLLCVQGLHCATAQALISYASLHARDVPAHRNPSLASCKLNHAAPSFLSKLGCKAALVIGKGIWAQEFLLVTWVLIVTWSPCIHRMRCSQPDCSA